MENNIQTKARIGGLLYLIIIASGSFAELYCRSNLIVTGNASNTAANILAHEGLWRSSIAADLLMHICDIPLMWIFYQLLKPAGRNLALLALLFNLIQTAVLVSAKLNLVAALFLAKQYTGLSYLAIKVHDYGYAIGLIFFGFTCLVNGYLIRKSGYLPKWIGYLILAAGICYLANSFALLLLPAIANVLFPLAMGVPFLAELSFCLWLLIKGQTLKPPQVLP